MKLKHCLLLMTCALALAACGKHDREYYYSTPEKAKKKVQDCNADVDKALIVGDKKAVRALKHDPECKAANSALMQIEDEAYEKERVADEVARYKAVQAKYDSQNWKEYLSTYLNSVCEPTNYSLDKDAECAMMEKLFQAKLEEGRKELAKIPYAELITQEKQYCAHDRRYYSACGVWQDVTSKQE